MRRRRRVVHFGLVSNGIEEQRAHYVQGTFLSSFELSESLKRRLKMDREHVKGVAERAKGAIKEGGGKVTGDQELETEGKVDKAKGDMHNAVGDVKDAVKNANKQI